MKRKQFHSLHFYCSVLLFLLLLLFTSLIGYNNRTAFSMLLNRIYRNTQDTAVLYQKQLDDILGTTETYLHTLAMDDSNLTIINSVDEYTGSWYSALFRLEKSMRNVLPVYTADQLFCYLKDYDTYVCANNSSHPSSIMRTTVKNLLAKEDFSFQNWSLMEADNSFFLIRAIKIQNTYIGAWVSLDTLFDTVLDQERGNVQLYLCTAEGKLLRGKATDTMLTLPDGRTSQYTVQKINGEKMLIVFQPMDCGSFYLTRFVPYSEVSDNNRSLITVILIVSFSFLLIWLLLFVFLRIWIQKPVSALTQAIEQLRNGNLDSYVPIGNQLNEFRHMSVAFNDMVAEIKDLKIDVYERKLQHQRLELQYLKQQITPHFMINCLNAVYQLMETEHPNLAKKMLTDLSHHIRYTLSSGQTVALGEEIRLVKNYVEISCIRYPDCISLFLDCPAELMDATAIPLLLLNFVENTIKYNVVMGNILEIHIIIIRTERNGQPCMHICIWDSGHGFSSEALDKLQHINPSMDEDNSHIGIINVLQRAQNIYQTPEFTFSNREGAGAQIDILLPCFPYGVNLPNQEVPS